MRNILLFSICITFSAMNIVNAQNVTRDDINTTCFVLSEMMDKAILNGDKEAIIIYSNAFDKIRKEYTADETYINYFNDVKSSHLNINQGIVISLTNPPKSPGFTNKEIDDFMNMKNDNIPLSNLNDFLLIKKLGEGKIEPADLKDSELKNIKNLRKEINQIQIEP